MISNFTTDIKGQHELFTIHVRKLEQFGVFHDIGILAAKLTNIFLLPLVFHLAGSASFKLGAEIQCKIKRNTLASTPPHCSPTPHLQEKEEDAALLLGDEGSVITAPHSHHPWLLPVDKLMPMAITAHMVRCATNPANADPFDVLADDTPRAACGCSVPAVLTILLAP